MTENPGREAYRKEHGSRMQPGRGLPGPQDVLNGPEAELSDTLSAYPTPGLARLRRTRVSSVGSPEHGSVLSEIGLTSSHLNAWCHANKITRHWWSPPEDQPKGFPCFRVMGFIKMNKSTSWLLASKSPAIVWVLPEGNPRQRFQGKQFI